MRPRLRRWLGRNWVVPGSPPFAYEATVKFLRERGVDEHVIRLGSIDALSMRFAAATIDRHARPGPLRVLHVGNFVGVSLVVLSAIVVGRDPGSVVVSIDPNKTHLGVDDPESHVRALLERFGVADNNRVVRGYTLDGPFDDLEARGERFDVALIDGNHDPDYLRGELEALVHLVEPGGLLILDDVTNTYEGVRRLFHEVAASREWPFEPVTRNVRLGILRRV
jgi:predicted O-methyltransferase YrrM